MHHRDATPSKENKMKLVETKRKEYFDAYMNGMLTLAELRDLVNELEDSILGLS